MATISSDGGTQRTTKEIQFGAKGDYITAARTPDGKLAIAYLPTVRPVTVDMAQLRGPVSADDPSHGVYSSIVGAPFPNRGTRLFTPPSRNGYGDSD